MNYYNLKDNNIRINIYKSFCEVYKDYYSKLETLVSKTGIDFLDEIWSRIPFE
ncbi:MAG: hypothetical protein QXU20_02740 [Candidatus Woesearchaeota archaeon]